MKIEASIGDFNVFGERTDLENEKEQGWKGVPTPTRKVKYSIPTISIKVADKMATLPLRNKYIFCRTDENTYTTSYYNSLSELDSYWRINRTSKLTDLQRDKVKRRI
ncbi:MAG: hypothetical protein IPP15_13280 [Saprospiraceae bacterium]|uniref:Uncharacterized protein n=1 Tax=Candidatus Opimibacter skivensis TaxID=2982028 RepID=A0A9D7SYW0_9BACT|nr:hypothetical protein [Candidatus Opimibacter skivensis]